MVNVIVEKKGKADNRVTVRNLDLGLLRKAKADAVMEGKTLGRWLNEAIELKLQGIAPVQVRKEGR